MKGNWLVVAILFFQLVCPAYAWAGEVNLDLGSTAAEHTADQLLGDHGVTSAEIHVGGTTRTVSPGTMLTPAELLAVQQVLSAGQQSILLGSAGNAVGGSFTMTAALTEAAHSLVIPQGVTAVRDFATASALNLTGNLVNSGNLFAVSSSNQVTNAAISAANILNQQGALLSSVLPASGLPGFDGVVANLNLSLSAVNDIINAGTITSSGNLNMSAGGSIVNALPQGVVGAAPVMQALSNLTLDAGTIVNQGILASQMANVSALTASLTNSGLIEAAAGSVTVSNLVGNTLDVNNALGAIQARDRIAFETLGSVLASNGEVLSKAHVLVEGGALAAERVQFSSPDGIVSVHGGRIDGAVEVSAGVAALGTQEGDLSIGYMSLSGDPIYYAQGGNLDLSGLFSPNATFATSGGDFVALATGNITATSAPSDAMIDASNGSGTGGKITVAAGVTFTVSGGSSPITCSSCDSLYSITGTSGTGGNVTMPNVRMLTNGNSISVEARAGSSSAGSVEVNHLFSSGRPTPASCIQCAGQNGGNITIQAASDISTGVIRAFGAGGVGNTGGQTCCGAAGGAGGNISVTSSGGAVHIAGDVNASGGGGGGGKADSQSADRTGGPGGNSGNVTIAANGALVIDGPVLAAGGGRGGDGGGNDGGGGGGSFGGGGGGGRGASGEQGGAGGGGFYGGGGGATGSSPGQGGGGGGSWAGGEAGAGGGSPTAGGFGVGGKGANRANIAGFAEGGVGASGGNIQSKSVGNDSVNGAAGAVSLSGQSVEITKTIGTAFGFTGTYADLSIASLGSSGSSIAITSASTVTTPQVYSADGNLLSTTANFAATVNSSATAFTVGQNPAPGSNGSAGNLHANFININGTNLSGLITSGSHGGSSGPGGSVTITVDGSPFVVNNGDFITPAQWIAVIQKAAGTQTLVLGAGGSASGGSFELAAANLPAGGFSSLVIPSGVVADAGSSSVIVNGATTVSGALNYTSGSLSAGSATVGGSLQGSGTLSVTTSGSLSVLSGGAVSAGNLSLSMGAGTTLSNAGTITATGDAGALAISSSGGLTLAGNGAFTATGNGANTITATAGGANSLVLAGDVSFNPGSSGSSRLVAESLGGSVELQSGVTVTFAAGTSFVSTPSVVMGAGSTLTTLVSTGTPLQFDTGVTSTSMSIVAPDSAGATISAGGGTIRLLPSGGFSFTKASGGGTGTLNINAGSSTGLVFGTFVDTFAVAANTVVNSNSSMSYALGTGSAVFTHNGTLSVNRSASGGSLNVTSSGDMTINGSGTMSLVSTGGAPQINLKAASGVGILTINSSISPNAGSGGTVFLQGGTINVAANAVLTSAGGSKLSILGARTFNMGANSELKSTNTSSSSLTVSGSGNSSQPLTFVAPDGGTARITGSGSTMSITAASSQSIIFAKAAGASSGTMFIGGAHVSLNITNGTITVDEGVTVASDKNLQFSGNSGSFTNNGMITTSVQGGSIQVKNNDGPLTIFGSGSYVLTAPGSGFTGNITFIAQSLGGAGADLNLTGPINADAGSFGNVAFLAQGNSSGQAAINVPAGVVISVNASRQLQISTSNLQMGAGSGFHNASNNTETGLGVQLTTWGSKPMNIVVPDSSQITISTASGVVSFEPFAGQPLTITKAAGAGTGTFNLNGGPVNMVVSGATTIGSGVAIVSDNALSITGAGITSSANISAQSVSLASTAALTAGGSIVAANGSVSVAAAAGLLEILGGAQLSATEGDVLLQNSDTVAGSISVGANAALSASTAGETLGRVRLVIGDIPASPVPGTTPQNVTTSKVNGGKIYFGANGISASAPSNSLTADGGAIVFETGSLTSSAISLGGGVTINSTAVPTVMLLTGLDLTDPDTISLIVQLQQDGHIGGTLQVSGGTVTGGNMVITPANVDTLLSSANIPANVTLTLQGFTASDALNFDPAGANTPRIVIDGTYEFVGVESHGVFNIGAPSDNGTALVVGTTGSLTSQGNLSVFAAGGVDVSGTLSATNLVVQATANDGGITVGGTATAAATMSLSAHGAGSVSTNGATLVSPAVSLGSGSGNISVATAAGNVSATTGGAGNVSIVNSGAVTVGASGAGGQFKVIGNDNVSTSGAIAANTLWLESGFGKAISLGANAVAAAGAVVSTGGVGSFSVAAGMALTAGGDSVIYTGQVSLGDGSVIEQTGAGLTRIVGAQSLSLSAAADGTATIAAAPGGSVDIRPDFGQPLTFAKSGEGGQATFNLNGEVLAYTSGSTTTVDAGVTLANNDELTIVVTGGGTLVNNGSFSIGGDLNVYSYGSAMTLTGTPQASTISSPGGRALFAAYGNVLTVDSSYSFQSLAGGYAQVSGAAVNFGAGRSWSVSGDGALVVDTGNLSLGAGTTLSSARSTGQGVLVPAFAPLTITVPGGSSATIATGGSTIDLSGTSVSIVSSNGAAATLNLQGPASIQATSGDLTVGANVTVSSDANITMQVGSGQSLVSNGSITSSAFAGSISLTGSNLTLAGSPGPISVTGGGPASISVVGFGSGLTLAGSYQFNAGSGGSVHIGASSGDLAVAAGEALSVTGGSQLVIVATSLLLGNGSSISSDRSSGQAISILSSYTPLTVAGADGAVATISTAGGSVAISPIGGGMPLTFGRPGDTATINFTGGPVAASVTVAPVTVHSNTTVTTDSTLTVTTSSFNSLITNDGTLQAAGQLELVSAYDLTLSGSGNVLTTGGSILVTANVNQLNITHNVQANEGNLTLRNTDTVNGSINIGAGSFLKAFTADKGTGFGHVTLVIGNGPASQSNTANPDSANISVTTSGGGQVYFGAAGVTAVGGSNSVQGIGTDVTFDGGGRPADAITLGGNVTIIADPPLAQVSAKTMPVGRDLAATGTAPASGAAAGDGPRLSPRISSVEATVLDSRDLDFRSFIPFVDRSTMAMPLLPEKPAAGGSDPAVEAAAVTRAAEAELVPVSFVHQAAAHAGERAEKKAGELGAAVLDRAGGTVVSREQDGVYRLSSGEVLVRGEATVVVLSNDFAVTCAPAAIVLIRYEDGVLTVRALGGQPGSVRVCAGGHCIAVAPGQQAVVGPEEGLVKETLNSDAVGCRRVSMVKLSSGKHHLAQSDISLVSLARGHPLLQRLMNRSDRKSRAAAAQVVKTAACLTVVTARHGAYSRK